MNQEHFDYRSVSEETDSLDYSKRLRCPHCGIAIAEDATMCYFCGEAVSREKRSPWVAWVVAAFILLLIVSLAL